MASHVQGNRRVEVACMVCFVCITFVGTLTALFWRRNRVEHTGWCGPTHNNLSVEITGALETSDGEHYRWLEGGITFPRTSVWEGPAGRLFGCPCMVKSCLRKCCNRSVEFDDDLWCTRKSQTTFTSHISNVFSSKDRSPQVVGGDHFFVMNDFKCVGSNIIMVSPEERPTLLDDGRVFIHRVTNNHLDPQKYCLDVMNGLLTFMECEPPRHSQTSSWQENPQAVGMLVSVPFLLATLLVYGALPSLRNLHGKALMCHLFCLSFAYTAGALINLDMVTSPSTVCVITAVLSHTSCLGTFFWLNVICTDIWWIFSDISSACNLRSAAVKALEHRRFMLYSMYAWGSTVAITAVAWFMDRSPLVPEYYVKPQFGVNNCWFGGNDAQVLYLYLPMGLLLGVNLIMFTTTALRLWAHRSSRTRSGRDKQRFNVFGKLFLVMGLNWTLELASFSFKGHSDTLNILLISSGLGNSLQGVIVFFLFVCKPTVLSALRARWCPSLLNSCPYPRSGSCSSHATRSSTLPATVATQSGQPSVPMATFEEVKDASN